MGVGHRCHPVALLLFSNEKNYINILLFYFILFFFDSCTGYSNLFHCCCCYLFCWPGFLLSPEKKLGIYTLTHTHTHAHAHGRTHHTPNENIETDQLNVKIGGLKLKCIIMKLVKIIKWNRIRNKMKMGKYYLVESFGRGQWSPKAASCRG